MAPIHNPVLRRMSNHRAFWGSCPGCPQNWVGTTRTAASMTQTNIRSAATSAKSDISTHAALG